MSIKQELRYRRAALRLVGLLREARGDRDDAKAQVIAQMRLVAKIARERDGYRAMLGYYRSEAVQERIALRKAAVMARQIAEGRDAARAAEAEAMAVVLSQEGTIERLTAEAERLREGLEAVAGDGANVRLSDPVMGGIWVLSDDQKRLARALLEADDDG